jgi:hypothetical protein
MMDAKIKKAIRITAITMFVLLAAMTFISWGVWLKNLPRVSIVHITSGYVPLSPEDAGGLQPYIVPVDALFPVGVMSYAVYAVDTRRGVLGMEEYVTAVIVSIIREDGQYASILPSVELPDFFGMAVARDIDGWVQSGDTVRVR